MKCCYPADIISEKSSLKIVKICLRKFCFEFWEVKGLHPLESCQGDVVHKIATSDFLLPKKAIPFTFWKKRGKNFCVSPLKL